MINKKAMVSQQTTGIEDVVSVALEKGASVVIVNLSQNGELNDNSQMQQNQQNNTINMAPHIEKGKHVNNTLGQEAWNFLQRFPEPRIPSFYLALMKHAKSLKENGARHLEIAREMGIHSNALTTHLEKLKRITNTDD